MDRGFVIFRFFLTGTHTISRVRRSFACAAKPNRLTRASLTSRVADISNMGDRFGGMMTAATFLREFVDAGRSEGDAAARTPWAHLDIAGPSFNESAAYGYTPQDATGVMVRTLLGLIEGRAR